MPDANILPYKGNYVEVFKKLFLAKTGYKNMIIRNLAGL
jgi:hypothetical protein